MYMYVWTAIRGPQEFGAVNKEEKLQADKKLQEHRGERGIPERSEQ